MEKLVTYLKFAKANITISYDTDVGPNKNVVSHLHTRQKFFVIIIQTIDAGRNSQLKQKLCY